MATLVNFASTTGYTTVWSTANAANAYASLLRLDNNSRLTVYQYDSFADPNASDPATVSSGVDYFVVAVWSGSVLYLYKNGALLASTSVATIRGPSTTIRVGQDGTTNGKNAFTGTIPFTAYWDNRALSGSEVSALSENPWQIFRKKARIIYFPSAGGGGATIAGDSLTHAHSLSSPSLTQSNVLAVQGVAQSHSLGAPALTQHNVLAVNAIAQAHALGNVTLTQAHILTVQGIGQAHSLGAPSLTQHNALTPAPLTQAQTLGNVTLTIAGSIAAANIAQGHSIGTPALTQHHVLTVAALMQAQSLGQPALAQAGTLAVDGMTQAQVLDALALVQHHALAVQALLQGHALGNVTLTASDALAIDGLTHAQILGSPSLTQHNVLAVQNMTHAQILQAVTLGGLVIGSLRGTLVAYSLLDGEVVCRALLSGSLETVH